MNLSLSILFLSILLKYNFSDLKASACLIGRIMFYNFI